MCPLFDLSLGDQEGLSVIPSGLVFGPAERVGQEVGVRVGCNLVRSPRPSNRGLYRDSGWERRGEGDRVLETGTGK